VRIDVEYIDTRVGSLEISREPSECYLCGTAKVGLYQVTDIYYSDGRTRKTGCLLPSSAVR
jgi:hypothetical protein